MKTLPKLCSSTVFLLIKNIITASVLNFQYLQEVNCHYQPNDCSSFTISPISPTHGVLNWIPLSRITHELDPPNDDTAENVSAFIHMMLIPKPGLTWFNLKTMSDTEVMISDFLSLKRKSQTCMIKTNAEHTMILNVNYVSLLLRNYYYSLQG